MALSHDYRDVGGRATHGAVADDYRDVRGRATHGAVADDCRDAGGRAKQEPEPSRITFCRAASLDTQE